LFLRSETELKSFSYSCIYNYGRERKEK